MLKIPVTTNGKARTSLSVNVGDCTLAVSLLWNVRDGRWYADIESVNGKNLGVRIVPNSRLLSTRNNVLSEGDIVVLKDESSCTEDIGFDNLGDSYNLYYLDDSDVEKFIDAGLL